MSPRLMDRKRGHRPEVTCRISNILGDGAGPPRVNSSSRGDRSRSMTQSCLGSRSGLGRPSGGADRDKTIRNGNAHVPASQYKE